MVRVFAVVRAEDIPAAERNGAEVKKVRNRKTQKVQSGRMYLEVKNRETGEIEMGVLKGIEPITVGIQLDTPSSCGSMEKGYQVAILLRDGKQLEPSYSFVPRDEETERSGYFCRGNGPFYKVFVHWKGDVKITSLRIAYQNGVPFFRQIDVYSDNLPFARGEEAVRQTMPTEIAKEFLSLIMRLHKELEEYDSGHDAAAKLTDAIFNRQGRDSQPKTRRSD